MACSTPQIPGRRAAASPFSTDTPPSTNAPLLSNFSQTFVIPQGAKALQFEILDADLDASDRAPGDAFEAALLDARTLTSLIAPPSGLTQTDSFLNLQHTGQTYLGTEVTSVFTANGTRLVTVDLSNVTANTLATLSFDLLGFGTREGSVTIDNVRLLNALPPIAQADTATTIQSQAIALDLLSNDSIANGSLQLVTTPTNGSIALSSNGTVTYTPTTGYIGTDTFIYQVADQNGILSNTAAVTITVNNAAPTITKLNTEAIVIEGEAAQFSAEAIDPGDDSLTYLWDFGDGTESSSGKTVTHTFGDNGTYTTTLTVTHTHGAIVTQTQAIAVANTAPIVNAGADRAINEGQSTTFNGSFTDPGILDTHTVTWDFGDGTTRTGTLTPSHTYATPGTYTATLTVRDKDGATQQDSLQLQVTPTVSPITRLKLSTHHLQLTLSENDRIVETLNGTQNQAAPSPQTRLQMTALNSSDRFTLFDDRTFLDHNEGIGIKDGEDSSSGSQKRIDGDEILQLKIQPTATYNSASSATIAVDLIQSNGTNGGSIKLVALRGTTIVGKQTYYPNDRAATLTYTGSQPFDRLQVMAGDTATQFTLRSAEFAAQLTQSADLPTDLTVPFAQLVSTPSSSGSSYTYNIAATTTYSVFQVYEVQ